MKSINFDEGYREYKINEDDQRIIRIRLTDPNLMKRVENAMKETQKLTEKYKGRSDAPDLAAFDIEVRQIINDAFGADVCTAALGEANVMTLTTGGKLLLFEFVDAFLPVLKTDMEAAAMTAKLKQPEVRPEVQRYIEPVTVKPVAGLAQPFSGLPDVSGLTPEQKRQLIAQLI